MKAILTTAEAAKLCNTTPREVARWCQDNGVRVPDDLAIVGFDDIPAARYVTPALTTVAQFQEKVGQRAAEMLLAHLASDEPISGRCIEMPFELKLRAST